MAKVNDMLYTYVCKLRIILTYVLILLCAVGVGMGLFHTILRVINSVR